MGNQYPASIVGTATVQFRQSLAGINLGIGVKVGQVNTIRCSLVFFVSGLPWAKRKLIMRWLCSWKALRAASCLKPVRLIPFCFRTVFFVPPHSFLVWPYCPGHFFGSVDGQVELWRETTAISIGPDAVKAASINGELMSGIAGQREAHLAVEQRNVGIGEPLTVTTGYLLPLARVTLNVDPHLESQISVATAKLFDIGEIKSDLHVSRTVEGINVKEVDWLADATNCFPEHIPARRCLGFSHLYQGWPQPGHTVVVGIGHRPGQKKQQS